MSKVISSEEQCKQLHAFFSYVDGHLDTLEGHVWIRVYKYVSPVSRIVRGCMRCCAATLRKKTPTIYLHIGA